MRKVGFGVIGCGVISTAYLKAAQRFAGLELRAVADMHGAAAEKQAAAFGVPALPVDQLLKRDDIEIVVNLTVPLAHTDVSLAVLSAGKHVHSEKPLGVTVAEARRVIDLAAAKGLRIGCAPDTFLGGGHQTARKAIDDGAIGQPVAGTAFFMCPGHERWHPAPGFYYLRGGGPMLDMGPYYITNLVLCASIIGGWLKAEGFDVRIETATSAFADPAIHDLSLIVPICTMAKIEKAEALNLCSAVQSGVGMGGHHGGMGDAFRDSVEYQFLCGGQWVAHPGGIIDYKVDVTRPDDPVMAGLPGFAHRSEQYYMHVDPANEVLATTKFSGEHAPWIEGVVMPVVWKKQYGAGRVFYSSLGHRAYELDLPEIRTIMTRGLLWAAR